MSCKNVFCLVWCLSWLTLGTAWELQAAGAGGEEARDVERPHLVLILVDDLCPEQLHCLGDESIQTPRLDELFARGTTFRHAYNMGSWSGAVCIASRTMLNTGRSLWRAERVSRSLADERDAGRLWSQILREAGYRTLMTGKWHVSLPAEQIFDVTGEVRGGMPMQTEAGYDRPAPDGSDPWDPAAPEFGGFWEGGQHWSERTADEAIEFIKQMQHSPDPCFLYIAFNAPHDPRQAPRWCLDLYPAHEMPIPVNFLPEYPFKEAMGCGIDLRDERLCPFPRTPAAIQVHRREYNAIITHLDQQIGRILDALDAAGVGDSAWICFTSDHGLACGQHGLLGKQNMYDHSVRVPFLLVGPGAPAGLTITTPIQLQDIVPTTIELAGREVPEHVEFHSLLPLLAGNVPEEPPAVYGAYLDRQRMISLDGNKLILYPEARAVRLYHTPSDPHETRDLAGEESSRPIIRRLFRRLLTLQAELEDPLELQAVYPDL